MKFDLTSKSAIFKVVGVVLGAGLVLLGGANIPTVLKAISSDDSIYTVCQQYVNDKDAAIKPVPVQPADPAATQ